MKYSISIIYKYIVIIIIFYLIIKNILILNKIKVCLCTVGKKENKYIREFVAHYKNYGVDKIFLYDNKGIERPQLSSYKDCYRKHYRKYNWLIFYDIDEFIFLKNYSNIKDFLNIFNTIIFI